MDQFVGVNPRFARSLPSIAKPQAAHLYDSSERSEVRWINSWGVNPRCRSFFTIHRTESSLRSFFGRMSGTPNPRFARSSEE